jgi:CubicO group peptidase (beta-lactamase class C family)
VVLVGVAAAMAAEMGMAACGSEPHRPDRADQADRGCAPAVERALGAWGEAGFSGSIAIATDGRPDCVAAYGEADRAEDVPNTPDTVFSIGSIAKAFTAAAVFHLVDDGQLALDARAGDLVPGLTGPAAGATVEQLLLHTSGLTGSHGQDHQPLDHDEAVAAIGRLEQAFPPGTGFLYSNAGYTLLALIVEQASGRPFRDYVADEILPLPGGRTAGGFWDGEPAAPGPRAVGYLDDGPTAERGDFAGPHWALAGNGDLAMTMGDLAAWTDALFSGEIVSPASAAVIEQPGFDQGDGTGEAPGWVTIAPEVYGERLLTTAGGGGDIGHDAVVVWIPERRQAIALASNTPDVTAEQLLDAVGPALLAGDPLPTPEPVGDVDPSEAAAVVGSYELPTGGAFTVSAAAGDRLAVAARGADAVAALFPLPTDAEADGDVGTADVHRHEEAVRALLAGETRQGREERAAVESALGGLDDVTLAGTVVEHDELRTYVTLASGSDTTLAWYSLDDEGGVAAAELATDPPTLQLGTDPSTDPATDPVGHRFRPDDPTATGPDVTVAFADGQLTVTSPAGHTTARLAR